MPLSSVSLNALIMRHPCICTRNHFCSNCIGLNIIQHRALVSQPEALEECEQFVAAKTYCSRIISADSLNNVNTGSVIESGCGRNLSDHCRGTVARQTTADRRSVGSNSCAWNLPDFLSATVSTGSPQYPPSQNNLATQDCRCSHTISSKQHEFRWISPQLYHHSGDAILESGCLTGIVRLAHPIQ